MDNAAPVLVLITEEPRTSHRANEALRIALGIVAGENDVTIVLSGPAAHLLDADTDNLVDGDDIDRYRTTLRKLDIPIYVEASAIPIEGRDWNDQGHQVIRVSAEQIAELMARCRRFIVF